MANLCLHSHAYWKPEFKNLYIAKITSLYFLQRPDQTHHAENLEQFLPQKITPTATVEPSTAGLMCSTLRKQQIVQFRKAAALVSSEKLPGPCRKSH